MADASWQKKRWCGDPCHGRMKAAVPRHQILMDVDTNLGRAPDGCVTAMRGSDKEESKVLGHIADLSPEERRKVAERLGDTLKRLNLTVCEICPVTVVDGDGFVIIKGKCVQSSQSIILNFTKMNNN
jgi:hypothetical protein